MLEPYRVALLVFAYRPRTGRIRGLSLLLAAYGASLWMNGRAYDWSGGYCYGTRYVLGGLPGPAGAKSALVVTSP